MKRMMIFWLVLGVVMLMVGMRSAGSSVLLYSMIVTSIVLTWNAGRRKLKSYRQERSTQ